VFYELCITQLLLISIFQLGMPKVKTLQLPPLSIFSLKQSGYLACDSMTELRWSEWGESKRVIIEIFVNTSQPHVLISLERNGRFTPIQTINLNSTPCNFGGYRYWFRCLCGERVAILYKMDLYFLCRHCGDLAYPLQQVTHSGRWRSFYRSLQGLSKVKQLTGQIKHYELQ
jgi:hypothetical protein